MENVIGHLAAILDQNFKMRLRASMGNYRQCSCMTIFRSHYYIVSTEIQNRLYGGHFGSDLHQGPIIAYDLYTSKGLIAFASIPAGVPCQGSHTMPSPNTVHNPLHSPQMTGIYSVHWYVYGLQVQAGACCS